MNATIRELSRAWFTAYFMMLICFYFLYIIPIIFAYPPQPSHYCQSYTKIFLAISKSYSDVVPQYYLYVGIHTYKEDVLT